MTHICKDERHYGRPATYFVPWLYPWFYKCDECRAEMEARGWHFEPIPEFEAVDKLATLTAEREAEKKEWRLHDKLRVQTIADLAATVDALTAELAVLQRVNQKNLAARGRLAGELATMTAERDRYREFVEWIFVATADGTLNLDTPAILDGLQCRSAEVLGEERAEELFSALNREE